jgi:hypothetical protein
MQLPYKPNAVRRGANRQQTPAPAWFTRGLTAVRFVCALNPQQAAHTRAIPPTHPDKQIPRNTWRFPANRPEWPLSQPPLAMLIRRLRYRRRLTPICSSTTK